MPFTKLLTASRRMVRCCCLLAAFLLVAIVQGTAQRTGSLLAVRQPSPVTCTPSGSFTCTAILYNNGHDTLSFKQLPFSSEFFTQLQVNHLSKTIAPGDSLQLTFRFINKLGKINGDYHLPVVIQTAEGNLVPILFTVILKGGIEPGVFTEVLQERLLLMPGTNEFSIPVRFRSLLPGGTIIWLELADPHTAIRLSQPVVPLRLPQLRDTVVLVPFTRQRNAQVDASSERVVNVRVRDNSGKMLTLFSFQPRMLASSRSLYANAETPAGISAGVFATHFGKELQTEWSLAYRPANPNDPLSLQLSYLHLGDRFRQMHASWITYRKENWQATAGNIADFHELNLQGKGLAATVKLPEVKLIASAWLVDNNNNLLNPWSGGYQEQTASTQLAYGGWKGGDLILNGSWFRRAHTFSHGSLQFAEWRPAANRRQYVSILLGTSQERFSKLDTSLYGLSARVEWRTTGKTNNWYARAQYATPVYAGNQRGQMSGILQNTFVVAKKHPLSLRWQSFYWQTPAALNKVYGYGQQMSNHSFEAEFTKATPQFSFHIKPYLLVQQQSFPMLLAQDAMRASAANTSLLGVVQLGKSSINIQWDGGLLQSGYIGKTQKKAFAWRGSGGFSLLGFNTSAQVQHGGFLLSELQSVSGKSKPFQSVNINIGYGKNIGKHLNLHAMGSISKSSFIGTWQHTWMQQLLWNKGKWQASGTAYLFGGRFDQLQIRAGIQKSFQVHRQPNNMAKLEIVVYEDLNGNGQQDTTEPLAKEQLVQIDGVLMITNAKGYLRVSKVPQGYHRVEVLSPGTAGRVVARHELEVKKSARIAVGVPPFFIVSGRVTARQDRFTSQAESVGNIRVKMEGADVEFTTFTKADGSFSFQAPAGQYAVYIYQLRNAKTAGATATIYVDPQQGYTGRLELIWTAGERPVQVKKVKIQ